MTSLSLSAVFFRAPSLEAAGQVLGGLLAGPWHWDHRYDVQLLLDTTRRFIYFQF